MWVCQRECVAIETYHMAKETYHMASETYHMAKETYHMAKETYHIQQCGRVSDQTVWVCGRVYVRLCMCASAHVCLFFCLHHLFLILL